MAVDGGGFIDWEEGNPAAKALRTTDALNTGALLRSSELNLLSGYMGGRRSGGHSSQGVIRGTRKH
jgi:hypothetical protein